MATYEPILDEVLLHTHPGDDITGGTVGGAVPVRAVNFSTNSSLPVSVGQIAWNVTDGTLDVGLAGDTIKLAVGQEQVVRVVNKTDNDLLKENYQVVRARRVSEGGAQGQRVAVLLAQGDAEIGSNDILGLVAENITKNQEGFITISGQIDQINTTGSLQGESWSDGDILYLSPTTPGGLTIVAPQAPDHLVVIGYVEYAHANNGKILVAIRNSWELDELHNVRITQASLTQNQVLAYMPYNASISLWQNTNAANLSLSVFMQLDVADTTSVNFTYSAPTLSAVVIPSGIPHNSLASLQGGTIDEFFHLSGSLASIASRQANASLSGYLSFEDWFNFSNLISFPTLPLVVADTPSVDLDFSFPTLSAIVLGGGIVHGSLASLSIDDHTQYALLAGRSGGQTLNGGTASGDDLTLSSTANATKGKILFGTSAYDEANNRLGIGTASPRGTLDVVSGGSNFFERSSSTVSGVLAIYNPDTTDANGNLISFHSDTTGTGAAATQLFGQISTRYDVHDHATRSSTMFLQNYIGGNLRTTVWVANNGNVGLLTSGTPAFNLALGNTGVKTIGVETSGSGVSGRDLTIKSGDSGAGSNLNAGTLALRSGLGTGTGASFLTFSTGQTTATATDPQVMTERMRINNAGNVGIRNTAPIYTLDVGNASATNQTIRILAASGNDTELKLMELSDSYGFTLRYDGGSDFFDIIRHNNDATGASTLRVLRTTGNVGIDSTGTTSKVSISTTTNAYAGSLTALNVKGFMELQNSESGSNAAGQYWRNLTSNKMWGMFQRSAAGSPADGLTLVYYNGATFTNDIFNLYPNGNVGFGVGSVGIKTLSPSFDLSFGNAANRIISIENSASATAGRNLKLEAGNGGAGTNIAGGTLELEAGVATGNAASNITFATSQLGVSGTTAQTLTERMRITNQGRVGINDTAPALTLDVNGDFTASGVSYLGSPAFTNVAVYVDNNASSTYAMYVDNNHVSGYGINVNRYSYIERLGIGSNTGTGTQALDVGGDTVSQSFQADGDSSRSGTISYTGTSNLTANSTGTLTIKSKGTTNRDSAGFIKIYIGTTAYYVPVFTTITG